MSAVIAEILKKAELFDELLNLYPNVLIPLIARVQNDAPIAAFDIQAHYPVTSFLSLPPEIRNTIYEFALTSAFPIQVSRRKGIAYGTSLEKQPKSTYVMHAATRYSGKSRLKGTVKYGSCFGSGLLRVSRVVRDEALPIVLSSNRFGFTDPCVFGDFVSRLRDKARFLEDLTIGRFRLEKHARVLLPLKDCRNLRRLYLTLERVTRRHDYRRVPVSEVAEQIWTAIGQYVLFPGRKDCICVRPETCTCISLAQQKKRLKILQFWYSHWLIDFGDSDRQYPFDWRRAEHDRLHAAILRKWQQVIAATVQTEQTQQHPGFTCINGQVGRCN